MVEALMVIEDKFDIEISAEKAEKIQTIEDAIKVIKEEQNKGVEKQNA
jgi:acyl carrier protein